MYFLIELMLSLETANLKKVAKSSECKNMSSSDEATFLRAIACSAQQRKYGQVEELEIEAGHTNMGLS